MTDTVPSKFATCPVSYGEKRKHLCPTDHEAFEFHATEEAARKAMAEALASGDKMIALLRVEGLYKAAPVKVERV